MHSIVWISRADNAFKIGRCGSTLLAKLFEDLPNTVSISEPEILMAFRHEPTFDDEVPQRKIQLLQVRTVAEKTVNTPST